MHRPFEMSGVWASNGKEGEWVSLKEIKPAEKVGYIGITVGYCNAGLTPCEAKRLAEQLQSLAESIEERGK